MTKDFFDTDEPLTPTATKSSNLSTNAAAAPNKKIRKIALIAAPLLICAIATAYFFFKVVRKPKEYSSNASNNVEAAAKASEAIASSYVALEPIIVNLVTNDKNKPVYLRLTLTLRVSSADETKIVQAKIPILIDSFQTFLTGIRAADFNNTSGPLLLKEELIKRVNKIIAPIIVKDVLFKEIMIN